MKPEIMLTKDKEDKQYTKYCIDLHDFSHLQDINLLDDLNRYFDNFKITLFAIPNLLTKPVLRFIEFRKYIELGIHGWNHSWQECQKWSYDEAIDKLQRPFKMSPRFEREFAPPRWQIGDETRRALNDLDFILMDHPDLRGFNILPQKRYFHEMDLTGLSLVEARNNKNIIKVHGHYRGNMSNDLDKCFKNFFKLPRNIKFMFISELFNQN